jgi:glutathione S-transferase/alpha,alpha-trehalase
LVNWALHELGVEFSMGDLRANPHPFGQIPSLKVGDATLFESGAILAYLQNMFGKETDARIKALIFSWIVWANASLDPICFLETPDGKVYDTGLKNPKQRRILQLNDLLAKQEYMVSDKFSLADVAVASYLLYVPQFFPDVKLGQWPHLVAYMKRCAERPAYGKAFSDRTQGFLVDKLTKALEKGSGFDLFGR